MNITVYALSLSVIEYQTAILREDYEAADELLPRIPSEQRNRIARFLEQQGKPECSASRVVVLKRARLYRSERPGNACHYRPRPQIRSMPSVR